MSKQIKTILKFLAIVFLAIIQITVLPKFAIYGAWPNLILTLALVLVLLHDDYDAFLTIVLGGVILDLGSSIFFGFYVLFGLIFVSMVRFIFLKFITETTFLVFSGVIFLTIFLSDAIVSLFLRQFFITQLLINSIYTLIIAMIIYRILKFNFHKSDRIGLIKVK